MTIYVINTDKNTFVAKFADMDSAEKAMAKVRFNPYFIAKPADLDTFSGSELVSIHNGCVDKERATKRFASKGVALDRTWTAIKNAEPKVTRAARTTSAVGHSGCARYPSDAVIRVLVSENPCHASKWNNGFSSGNRVRAFDLYKDGMTIGDYVAARRAAGESVKGSLCGHLYYDIKKGHVEVEV